MRVVDPRVSRCLTRPDVNKALVNTELILVKSTVNETSVVMLSRIGMQQGGIVKGMGLFWVHGSRMARSPWGKYSVQSTMRASVGLLRSVHNTSKKDHTSVITTDLKHSTFHKMSLSALKNECRSRGLKVSGKKAELVERITSFNGSGHKIQPVKKEKMSTVSIAKKPAAKVRLRATIEVPKSQKMSTTSVLTDSKVSKPSLTISNAPDSKRATDTQATNQTKLRDTVVVQDQLTWRDRIFLMGFAGVAMVWWGAQSSDEEAG